ncbi:ATP-dependent DNA helicase DinG [Pseudomonadota bacterium]|nr:ATP-dependent DNA helicase DinG [Pseudomonadota bacterium]
MALKSVGTVETLFNNIEQAMPDFKSRPQQVEMSNFIYQKLSQGDHQRIAVVEAPTGVGKTLAYLAGAIDIALEQKKMLVISTATVNLQQQLLQKDLPQFAHATGKDIKFIQAKGRRRYLCPSKLTNLVNGGVQQDLSFDVDAKYQQAKKLTRAKAIFEQWDKGQWDGDRDSRTDSIEPAIWHDISTDSEGCAGKSCSKYLRCPYYIVRKEIQTAQVIIANHDLVLSDADLGGGLVLPNPEEVLFIFDEAHNLPQKALDHAAKALNFSQLYQTTETADSVLKKLIKALAHRQHDFGFMLMELRRDLPAVIVLLQQMETLLQSDDLVKDVMAGKISEPRIYWQSPLVKALVTPCQSLLQRANIIYKHYKVFAQWVKDGIETQQVPNRVAEVLLPQIGTVQNIFGYLIDFMGLFLDEDKPDFPPNVRWLSHEKFAKTTTLVINSGPMTAAYFLEKSLWNRAYGVVLTSATLRGLGLFQRFRGDCGLRRFGESHFLAVKSPFDYQRATLSLPEMTALPNENMEGWQQEVVSQLKQTIDIKEATLVLFTSKMVMDSVYRQLPTALADSILLQGDSLSPKNMIIEHVKRIKQGQGSIIFGMDRFAEGVDLPGELCSHVVITKLPFPVFTRPIEQAKQEWILRSGGQPFVSLSLPAVSIRLIQACGRLLRKETDSGRITILDRRLLTKAYGKQLLKHLPGYKLI